MPATKKKQQKEKQFDPAEIAAANDPVDIEAKAEPTTAPKRAAPAVNQVREITITVPVGERGLYVKDGFAVRSLDVSLTRKQAAAAKMGACVVSDAGGRAPGGPRPGHHPEGGTVEHQNDFVRYLLQRFADAVESQLGKDLETDFNLTLR